MVSNQPALSTFRRYRGGQWDGGVCFVRRVYHAGYQPVEVHRTAGVFRWISRPISRWGRTGDGGPDDAGPVRRENTADRTPGNCKDGVLRLPDHIDGRGRSMAKGNKTGGRIVG